MFQSRFKIVPVIFLFSKWHISTNYVFIGITRVVLFIHTYSLSWNFSTYFRVTTRKQNGLGWT